MDFIVRIAALAARRGLFFEHFPVAYAYDVVTCAEAALARGISIEHELKHVVIETSAGLQVVHVQGHKRVNLRSVKKCLSTKQAHMADLSIFNDEKIQAGTVCPFMEVLWSLPHLIDNGVWGMPWLATNDGTLRGYVKFEPKLLCLADTYRLGNFSKV